MKVKVKSTKISKIEETNIPDDFHSETKGLSMEDAFDDPCLTLQKRKENIINLYTASGADLFIAELIEKYGAYPPKSVVDVLYELYESKIIKSVDIHFYSVRTIAVHWPNWNFGGVGRYITKITPMMQAWGKRVILLLDKQPKDKSYPFPDGMEVFVLPSLDSPAIRVAFLKKFIETEKIDLLYSQKDYIEIPDILVWKLLYHIPVINHLHNTVVQHLLEGNIEVFQRVFEYRKFADLNICLSRNDELFLRLNGCAALYLPNPMTFSSDEDCIHSPGSTNKTGASGSFMGMR